MAIQRRSGIAGLVLMLTVGCGSAPSGPVDGKALFDKNCRLCHGSDGKKMMAGAPDLTLSSLSKEENVRVILNGKGTMPPFANALTQSEAEAVAEYLLTLRK